MIAANRAATYGTISRWVMHDVRSPTQAISLVHDLLLQGDDLTDPMLQETLRTASGRLRKLLDLLDRALRFPLPHPEPEPLPVSQLVEPLAAVHATRHGPIGFDYSAALAPPLPAVKGIEDRIEHALLNLLLNAHEAVAEGRGSTIRLSGRAASNGRWVELVMEDDGPGVPAEVKDRLFQPFVTTKKGRPLAGLGLAVTKMLIEDLGGSVRHEPARSGASFVVQLPAW